MSEKTCFNIFKSLKITYFKITVGILQQLQENILLF